ncbi:hypothetical protein BDZ89DRAFT_1156980 [Hymenopellis radicata]|nr:hypothetical protein BDZ89DRAFT_1156980 [Hymenopellis radicata]
MLLGPAVDAEETEVYLGASLLSSNDAIRDAAGCAVFWGDADSRNISERCPKPCRTYGEALLHALRRFLEEIGAKKNCDDADSIRKFVVVTSSVCLIMTFVKYYTPSFTDVNGAYIRAYDMPVVEYILALLDNAKRHQVKIEFLLVHKGETYGGEEADRLAERGAGITDRVPEEQDWASIETAVRKRMGCAPSQWPRAVETRFSELDEGAQARIRSRRILYMQHSELDIDPEPVVSHRKRKRSPSEDVSAADARPCKMVKVEDEVFVQREHAGHEAEADQSETKDLTIFDEDSADMGQEPEDDPFDSDSESDGLILKPEPYPDVQLPVPVEPVITSSQESNMTVVASSQTSSEYDPALVPDPVTVNQPPTPAPTKASLMRILNIQKGCLESHRAAVLPVRKVAQPFPMMTPKQEMMHVQAGKDLKPPPTRLFPKPPGVVETDVTYEELEKWESMSDFDIE